MLRRPWLFAIVLAAVAVLVSFSYVRVARADATPAGEELYWAFRACDEGMLDATAPARRVQLLDDYRFRRDRAVHADAAVVKTTTVHDYAVREWLPRCDTAFPKMAAPAKKEAAAEEAETALTQCRTATTRGSLEEAEADYRAFQQNKESALRHDPKVRAKRQLVACDKRVAAWLSKRRETEDEAIKRIRADAQKTIADANLEQENSLGGSSSSSRAGASARLAVAIPVR